MVRFLVRVSVGARGEGYLWVMVRVSVGARGKELGCRFFDFFSSFRLVLLF
jgi:hypothetical protein